jgi:hypothetical protein
VEPPLLVLIVVRDDELCPLQCQPQLLLLLLRRLLQATAGFLQQRRRTTEATEAQLLLPQLRLRLLPRPHLLCVCLQLWHHPSPLMRGLVGLTRTQVRNGGEASITFLARVTISTYTLPFPLYYCRKLFGWKAYHSCCCTSWWGVFIHSWVDVELGTASGRVDCCGDISRAQVCATLACMGSHPKKTSK